MRVVVVENFLIMFKKSSLTLWYLPFHLLSKEKTFISYFDLLNETERKEVWIFMKKKDLPVISSHLSPQNFRFDLLVVK